MERKLFEFNSIDISILARFGPPINDVTLLLINAGTESW